jgi:hypothetical protein
MKAHFIYSLDFWLLFSNGKVTKKTVEMQNKLSCETLIFQIQHKQKTSARKMHDS